MRAGSLSLTRPLLQWLQADPAWRSLSVAQRARLHWQARLGSVNHRLAQLNTGPPRPGENLDAPVLVLGPWRSGTTVMHELLAAATGLSTPRTWQCMNAATFTTLPAKRRSLAAAVRPMDGLVIDAMSPQEDEFALLTLGADSAYRAFWMPHRIAEMTATLKQAHWLADDSWLRTWEWFLLGVLRNTPQARQPMLLKSPNHSFRLQAILRRFPAARVVWMVRDGVALANSNLKMWNAMFRQHGLTAPRPGALEAFIAQALYACADTLDQAGPLLTRGRCMVVPQTRLRTDGAAVVREVHARLQLPGLWDEVALRSTLARLASGRQEHDASALAPALEAAARQLDAAQGRALSAQQAW